MIDPYTPTNSDISFILELDEETCTDQVIRLLEAGTSSSELLERMRGWLTLGYALPVNVVTLEKAKQELIRQFAASLRNMLAVEYKKADAMHSLSDHTGVSAEQDSKIHEALRIRYKQ